MPSKIEWASSPPPEKEKVLFEPPEAPISSRFWLAKQKSHITSHKTQVESTAAAAAATIAAVATIVDQNAELQESPSGEEESKELLVQTVEIDGDQVALDSEIVALLPVEKKEEIAKTYDPFRFIPNLNIKTEHARYVSMMATKDPESLIGWQVLYCTYLYLVVVGGKYLAV